MIKPYGLFFESNLVNPESPMGNKFQKKREVSLYTGPDKTYLGKFERNPKRLKMPSIGAIILPSHNIELTEIIPEMEIVELRDSTNKKIVAENITLENAIKQMQNQIMLANISSSNQINFHTLRYGGNNTIPSGYVPIFRRLSSSTKELWRLE